MVGMPYPNRSSPELQEKMAYLNSTQGSHAGWYYPQKCTHLNSIVAYFDPKLLG
jgi:hypothetical protein